jgi:hypothetical protein
MLSVTVVDATTHPPALLVALKWTVRVRGFVPMPWNVSYSRAGSHERIERRRGQRARVAQAPADGQSSDVEEEGADGDADARAFRPVRGGKDTVGQVGEGEGRVRGNGQPGTRDHHRPGRPPDQDQA